MRNPLISRRFSMAEGAELSFFFFREGPVYAILHRNDVIDSRMELRLRDFRKGLSLCRSDGFHGILKVENFVVLHGARSYQNLIHAESKMQTINRATHSWRQFGV